MNPTPLYLLAFLIGYRLGKEIAREEIREMLGLDQFSTWEELQREAAPNQ